MGKSGQIQLFRSRFSIPGQALSIAGLPVLTVAISVVMVHRTITVRNNGEPLFYLFLVSIMAWIAGFRISCMEKIFLPAGMTMVLGLDIKEPSSISSR